SAVFLPDGYLAPLVAAQAIADESTHVFIDEYAHAALLDAARAFPGSAKTFKHRDAASLRRLLVKLGSHARPIVLTDGMFAHDGSVAPLREYLKILPRRSLILVDDAHGAGVLGATGRGSLEFAAVGRQRIIQCATLSKAFGAYGGVVLGSRALREKILARSRAFIGATPVPPPLAGAALAGLKILQAEPARRERLFENAAYLRTRLRRAGWEISETPGPIVRLPSSTEKQAGQLKTRLLAAGIYPPFLKYGKAAAQGVFRIVVSSEHTRGELNQLIAALQPYTSNPSTKGETA
ncbi:MAG TPA: aminotransferase class I/II-fold pyridoxal phosphate-dependent enzyme, partial [Verrucomicrobiae bacterium]